MRPSCRVLKLLGFLKLFLLWQIEREVTEAMMKSLKYCDLQTESARQPLYQYRAATIHHRLASMYHSCFRNQVGENSRVCPARRDHKFIRNSIFEMISRKK